MFFATTKKTILLCKQEDAGSPVECCVIQDSKTSKSRGHKVVYAPGELQKEIRQGHCDLRKISTIDGIRRHADDIDFETGGLKRW